jgi:hypothetical protein
MIIQIVRCAPPPPHHNSLSHEQEMKPFPIRTVPRNIHQGAHHTLRHIKGLPLTISMIKPFYVKFSQQPFEKKKKLTAFILRTP